VSKKNGMMILPLVDALEALTLQTKVRNRITDKLTLPALQMLAGECQDWLDAQLDGDDRGVRVIEHLVHEAIAQRVKDYKPERPHTEMTLGRMIRTARRAQDMSQATLARIVCTSQAIISMIERDTQAPTATQIAAIAAALGIEEKILTEAKGNNPDGR
jgi:DNA-binding XRE family transcriptional regulator